MKYILYILCLLFVPQVVISQQSDFNFVNFTTSNGLSSNTVNTILKDKYGFMWFGTDDGLNRFDGLTFSVYRHKEADSTSLGGNSILALHEDRSGNLWIGTNNTLSCYNRKKDSFINYKFTLNNTARTIFCDHTGQVWIGSYIGLFRLNPQTGKVVRYMADPGRQGALVSNIITCIVEDSRHRLWIGGNGGIYLYQPQADNFKHFSHEAADSLSLPGNSIKAMTEDHNGNLWIGTEDDGLSMLLPDGKHFRTYQYSNTQKKSLSSNCIWSLAAENANRIWVGTEEGLNIFDLQKKTSQRIEHDVRNRYSLQGKSVRSIYIDNNGIYWVGTYQGGISKYDKNLAFFNLRESNPFDPQGLTAPIVTSFSEDANGDIYVGTDGGGINLFHRNTGLFSHPRFYQGIKPPAVLSLEHADGLLWIGTFMHGIYTLNMQTGKVHHYLKGDSANQPSGNDIFCLKKDSRGNIWIGTNGNGVNVYDPVSGVFRRFGGVMYKKDSITVLNRGFIRTIEEDKAGNIWIGTIGAGIIMLDASGKIIRTYTMKNSDLPANNVQTICAGQSGRIWVGIHSAGLCLFDPKTGKFQRYAEQEGLSNAVIYKILEDDAGKVWVTSNKGISSFDPSTSTFKNYYQYNGLQRSTFCLGAGLKTEKGELFFGGLEGFNYFIPKQLNYNRIVPRIVLTDLKIGNISVIPGEHAAIQSHISLADCIRLDYKQHFTINFATLNYTAPQESRYSYMLQGFDKGWNEIGTSRMAVFSNLSPGKYVFKVRASCDDGAWHTEEAVINVIIRPPFWLTIYAYIFYLLAAVAVLWGLRYRAIRKLKTRFALEQERLQVRQAIEMDRKEAERQREFEQVKIKYLVNLSHEFRTPVSLIVGPVEKLIHNEIAPEKLKQLNLVKRNARRLLNMVNQLLDFRKLEEQETKLDLSREDIISFIAEVIELFKDISEHRQINFLFTSSISRYYTAFDRDKLERVLFNLLSNAFKFTPKEGAISLTVDPAPDAGIIIKVADTGVGMKPEVQEKIFNRFYQGDENPAILNQGSGIGLSITAEFVKMHGGLINVESIPGKGSTFSVLLPLEKMEEVILPDVEIPGEAVGPEAAHPVACQHAEVAAADKLTVLLVEDNKDFRYYLKDNLQPFYKVVEAADGREGWQKALSAHPLVIVSDINMPYMDGIQLSRKVRFDKRTSHIPVILLTALAGDAFHIKGLETGASDYLTKPFNIDILNIRIRNLILLNKRLKDTYRRQLDVMVSVDDVESADEKFLVKVKQYIENNINDDRLTVEELSRHLFMSRASLYNKVVQLTGETPVEFIRSIKLNKAACLLETSDMKIAQIGYAVGFSTPNYFARAFKAKFNQLPSEYQAQKKRSL
ncbi:two-component regulator propeller domain-containing protein [Chitinophaga sancti]|uniref:hybrid sensor histidine kinase/response regulator transcription factor n=1 Tax=Chitinophaga sancti TaxID=1004 RepID=UPI002A7516F8|nr:two-component regulator propeller domain-containing protein [Chitinophaga sancti]WPQ61443.1 two-component regulator propeller domain-containing protein [Chitinophaga sancti]